MVCSRCTLLQADYAVCCTGCGEPLCTAIQRTRSWAVSSAPVAIGVISGSALLVCLSATLMMPAIAAQALNLGSYFGILSIANVWLAIYSRGEDEFLCGLRGMAYSLALMISLVAELCRLQGFQSLALPALDGHFLTVPIPSTMATEVLAAALIIIDPLIIRPFLAWIAAGVEREEPAR